MTTEPVDRHEADGADSTGAGNRSGRVLQIVLPLFASAVFVLLWIYVALATFTDSALPADTWAWLSGLDLVPAVVAWVAILPLGVYLWALDAGLEPLWMDLVMLGLVAWTIVAWAGLARARLRR